MSAVSGIRLLQRQLRDLQDGRGQQLRWIQLVVSYKVDPISLGFPASPIHLAEAQIEDLNQFEASGRNVRPAYTCTQQKKKCIMVAN